MYVVRITAWLAALTSQAAVIKTAAWRDKQSNFHNSRHTSDCGDLTCLADGIDYNFPIAPVLT
jgi:hypothetical protein